MAKALFVKTIEIAEYTALNGNVDVDKFKQFMWIAQELDIQNYLGTDLYDKINDDILAGTLTGNYLTLTNEYIKPMLIHFTMVQYLPWAAYTIANQGVFKHSSENSESVSKNEVDYLIDKELSIAKHYAKRFTDYICFESALYPEYNTNSNGDMFPDKEVNFSNWFL
tara:strand:+ start:307 stop:807 length:501 start_codon:yes stop_codon:yes gene_type:complete